ncbi:hypothetical protein [Methanococcoides sp.]|uniref:hypothetical protein n=1 Tax=Methanococcoides sp. TaxID=1966350 RepID=UPI00272E1100|nr:hypothetical protein [Methanococcoides sp.]
MADETQTPKEMLERFRSFSLKFDKPLPNLVLKDLVTEKQFISRFANIDVLRLNDDVQSLILFDFDDINYVINRDNIQAKSPILNIQGKIKQSLESVGNLIKDLYKLEFGFSIEDGADFRYIENYNLQSETINSKITQKLKKEFGGNVFPISCRYVYKTPEGEKSFNLSYANKKDHEAKRLLIESDEEFINRLKEALS